MPVDIPPTILAPILQLGFAGVVILFLAWALFRKDKACSDAQEARLKDQKEHAAENQKSIEALDRLTRSVREQHEGSEHRWKITENIADVIKTTAAIVEDLKEKIARIERLVDANTIRLENIEKRRGE